MTEVWLMVNRKTGEVANYCLAMSSPQQARLEFALHWKITTKQATGAGWRAVKFVPAEITGGEK